MEFSKKDVTKNYKPINWNSLEDIMDKLTWEKVNSQYWQDTRIPVSNDLDDWRKMTDTEKWVVNYVFGGLTLLDTLQSEEGVASLKSSVRTQAETAVYNNFEFMESMHAKSYSTIFTTLATKQEIEEVFKWVENDKNLQYKTQKINSIYQHGTDLQKKIASVFLESFLFYSGFFTPLRFLGQNKLANVAEILKLIIRDESVRYNHS